MQHGTSCDSSLMYMVSASFSLRIGFSHSDGRTQTKSEYLSELSSRSRTNQAIANEDVSLRAYGDTAVVTGVSIQSGVSGGKPWSGRFRFTRVWVLRDGGWTMVASHSSRIASVD